MSAPAPACADLARRLPALYRRQDALDEECLRLRSRAAGRALEAGWREVWAAEDWLLATAPATPADAAALILLCAAKVDLARASEGAAGELRKVERGRLAALGVVADAAGVGAEEMGFADHLPGPARGGGA